MQENVSGSRRDLEARLIEKASKDAGFRRALIEDPKGTLERELQVNVPEGVDLTVLEETPTHRYLVLPLAPRQGGDELSEAELEAAAGGDPASGQTIRTYCGQSGCG
jgi:hypothetical protein